MGGTPLPIEFELDTIDAVEFRKDTVEPAFKLISKLPFTPLAVTPPFKLEKSENFPDLKCDDDGLTL